MKKVIIAMILSASIGQAQAMVITCVGMFRDTSTLKIMINNNTNEMIVNGQLHKTYGKTFNGKDYKLDSITTENYINDRGEYIHLTLGRFSESIHNGWILAGMNGITGKIDSLTDMSCSFTND